MVLVTARFAKLVASDHTMADWVAVPDPATGKIYYANMTTRETSWTPPPGFHSTQCLCGSDRRCGRRSDRWTAHHNARDAMLHQIQSRQEPEALMSKLRVALICDYWLRISLDPSTACHDHVVSLMVNFCFEYKFEWTVSGTGYNPSSLNLHSDKTGFSNDNMQDHWRSLISAKVLSAENMDKFRIELQLERCQFVNLMIGYIQADQRYLKCFDGNDMIGHNRNQLAWTISGDGYTSMFTDGNSYVLGTSEPLSISPKPDDKFELQFNFRDGTIIAFYNGKYAGKLTDNLPSRIYLAASVYSKGQSYRVTGFDITE